MMEAKTQSNPDAPIVKSFPPSVSEVDQRTAHRYLDIARSTISQTSTVAILWLVSVLIIYGSIERDVTELGTELRRFAKHYVQAYEELELERHLKILARERQAQTEIGMDTHIEDRKRSEPETRNLPGKHKSDEEDVSDHRANSSKANTPSKKDSLDGYRGILAKPVEFPLPGFTKFASPIEVAPLLLAGVILGLAVYMAFMRDRAFRYLSKALRLLKDNSEKSLDNLGDVLAPRPWWLAPLPKKLGESISPEEFASSLGWSSHNEASIVFPAFFWFTLIYIQYRLITLHSLIVEGKTYLWGYGVEGDLITRGLLVVSWTFFAMTVSIAARWFWACSVPDMNLTPSSEIGLSRRTFLVHAIIGTTLSIAANSSLYAIRHLGAGLLVKQPRFRKKRVRTRIDTLGDGLLLNPKSGVIHAVSQGCIVGLSYLEGFKKKPNVKEWKVLSGPDLVAPASLERKGTHALRLGGNRAKATVTNASHSHANKRHVSIIFEVAFRLALDKKQDRAALQILLKGIEHDIAFKLNAGVTGTIDLQTGKFIQSRRKPRKRHKGKRNISINLIAVPEHNVRTFPRVSIRLYDLLARDSVKLGQPHWLKEMLLIVKKHKLKPALESRMTKWSKADSKWYRGVTKQGRSSNVG